MEVYTKEITFPTKGRTDIIDISERLQSVVEESGLREGALTAFVVGSTAGITTVEYEPGLVKEDLPAFFEKLAPYDEDYAHHETWGDDNGAAHVRASLLGSSIQIPFFNGRLILGTWQQVICIDFDTRGRNRKVMAQCIGK